MSEGTSFEMSFVVPLHNTGEALYLLLDAFRTLVDALPERHDDLRSLLAMRMEAIRTTVYYDSEVRAHDLSSLTDMHAGLIRVTPYTPRAHPTSAPAMETPQTLTTTRSAMSN